VRKHSGAFEEHPAALSPSIIGTDMPAIRVQEGKPIRCLTCGCDTFKILQAYRQHLSKVHLIQTRSRHQRAEPPAAASDTDSKPMPPKKPGKWAAFAGDQSIHAFMEYWDGVGAEVDLGTNHGVNDDEPGGVHLGAGVDNGKHPGGVFEHPTAGQWLM